MSEDTYQIETRRRSRSKTPFLLAGDNQPKKKSTAPNVQTIVEEHVVESSSSKQTRSKAFAQLTSDYSSDDMTPEAKRKQTSTTTTVTSIITKRSGGATSTPRNRSQLETTQNTLNSAQEKLNHSNGNLSSGNVSDYLAYIEYRDAGEYWNKTPKTDYTYSELSPHRRQLAPGVVAMPNMSRRSLANHDERVNYMVQQNPGQEEFIRRRYQSKYTQQANYDSADELDATFGQQQKQSWWLVRLIQLVVSSVTTVWTRVTNLSATETNAYQNYYARRQQSQQTGLLGKVAQAVGGGFASLLRYLYIFIGSVLSLDTWLLRSSDAENKSKKRFLIVLLILLPLLLLTGLFYYIHPNETFPPKSLSEYTFTLPELPKINVSDYLNTAQYESLRSQAAEQAVRVRDWADDYVLYLRTIGQNVVNKGRQIFQADDQVYYERV
ncbi:klaroid protein isoform X3 [Drosophila gunungcola]|uniref:klaroid protein isoform X3 n=1 Tax=Drosophila gunungcola TaxID=103775 RepID=UPI0022E75668|nr:klaroid protein isoform X3 [Drosophila gunungcola]